MINAGLMKLGVAAVMAFTSVLATAAVTAEEAAKLKGELTPFGAERQANKEGTIPAWTGGMVTSGDKFKGDIKTNFFADDKPLYVITAANMAQYAHLLSEGQQALFKKFPDYKIEVFPTRRTAAAPQWVYDNTFKNATRAKLTSNGNAFEGAYGGIPFPIPKNGHEAMWNHQLRWQAEAVVQEAKIWVVAGGAKPALSAYIRNELNYPYYFKDGSLENFKGEYWMTYQNTLEPAFKAGEVILARDAINADQPRQAWQYLVGQRRVRKAPNIGYDIPNSVTSGFDFFDEVNLFTGGMDRFDWKLVGKKEMLIPYNNNHLMSLPVDDVLGPNFVRNVRWELHRVWVVEATVAEGKRQLVPRRRFYLDEDTWTAVLYDGWDAKGQLWHTGMALPSINPGIPSVASWGYAILDLIKNGYEANLPNSTKDSVQPVARFPESNFTPENVAARGVR